MILALTRPVPPAIDRCELTHVPRVPIDFARANEQHRAYEETLSALGCTIERLPVEPEMPDSVFVEDAAVVLPQIAVIARPGAESRRGEVAAVADALQQHRPLGFIEPPGTLDGGDVLCIGERVWIGHSQRTNADGIRQFRELVTRFGYHVQTVEVSRCLHLKSALTQVGPDTVLHNPEWIEAELLGGFLRVETHPTEPFAGNALFVGSTVLHPTAFLHTRERLQARGIVVQSVDMDELAKAEAGVTCCSILVAPSSH
jgi:dimethylargininase